MAENNQSPADFMQQMYDLQQQYFKNIETFLKPKQEQAPANPFLAWWEQMAPQGQPDFVSMFTNLGNTGMGQIPNPFADLKQNMFNQQSFGDWNQNLQQQFNNWAAASSMQPIYEQMNDQFRQTLQNPFASMPGGFSPFMSMQQPFTPAQAFESPVLRLLQNLFSDEEKQVGEQLLESLTQYQNSLLEYNHLLAQVGIDSLNQLQEYFSDQDNFDLQELYQKWMEISQQVFDQQQLSDNYGKLYSQLQATQEKLQLNSQKYRKVLIDNLGLAANEQIDDLKAQVENLSKELKALKSNVSASAAPADSGKPSSSDDFTVINGIGKAFNDKLHAQGISSLEQLAGLSDEMLKQLDDDLQSKGRIVQEQWREQAEQFLNMMTGKNK